MKKLLKDQSGVLPTLPLLLIIAVVGIISFLLLTSTAPFSKGIFSSIFPRQASKAATYTCTLIIGYSQTNNWLPNFLNFVPDSGVWESQIRFGGAAHYWIDPNFDGWIQSIDYPCRQSSNMPDRVIFDVTHDAYLDDSATFPDPIGTMEQIVRNLIPVIHQKYPSARQIVIQPVVGGPNHTICPMAGGRVRASVNHPYIHQAVDRVIVSPPVIAGVQIAWGNDSQVSSCDEYADEGPMSVGHLTNPSPVAHQIADFYTLGIGPTPTPTPIPTSTPTPIVTPTPSPNPTATPPPTPACSSPACPLGPLGDIDCDGRIDIFDYNILVGNFGKTGANIPGDLNNDGVVNIFDYNILVTNFGRRL